MRKSKMWLLCWGLIVCITLTVFGYAVYEVDPFMHYHAPKTEKYYYTLDNQRSQNDGIIKHFDYDALITGTSMTENFKTSEMDQLFSCNSIKVAYSGASYKEIGNSIETAIEHNPNLKIVIRGLDMNKFMEDKDAMRLDLGSYPNYLYDDNPFNDVQYIWNRDLFWNRVYPMLTEQNDPDFESGITPFDDYSSWRNRKDVVYGKNTVLSDIDVSADTPVQKHLSEEQKKQIKENITQNVTDIAKRHPDVTFYCFFTPYSAVAWKERINRGEVYQQIEAEKYVIELLLKYDNIKIFSINNRLDLTTDLNNYKDSLHYGSWINSLLLKIMKDDEYLITKENYEAYIEEELTNYLTFDYNKLEQQEDYENDLYAGALLNEELTGATPFQVLQHPDELQLNQAKIVRNNGKDILECKGRLNRSVDSVTPLAEYLNDQEYIGAKLTISNIDDYNYIVFNGKKTADHGQPVVCVIDDKREIATLSEQYSVLDDDWHQYVLDISDIKGEATIIINGGYTDDSGSPQSQFLFSDIILY